MGPVPFPLARTLHDESDHWRRCTLSGDSVVKPLLRVVFHVGGAVDGSTTAVTPRPGQPEPFVRGAAYPAFGDVPYPRANPTDTSRLPADIWHAATVPVGVRLEVVGDAQAIDIAYRTADRQPRLPG